MEQKTKETPALQWHPAFYAGIRIEFAEEAEKLVFENEHQLGTKPKEIDVLIIKKNSAEKLQKNIGQIFQKHNIVEYKSPDDYLSIDDFYKVYGYACFYKSDVSKADEIKAEDITISFVCKNCPRKLISHLEKVRHMCLVKQAEGIYYICGDIFRMQFIITSELSEESNLWLKNLTNDLKERKTAEKLLREYGKHKKDRLYKSVMDIIVRANKGKFEEVKNMCEALEELMKDELDARERQGEIIGQKRGEVIGQKRGEAIGQKRGEVIGQKRGEVIGQKRGEVIGQKRGEMKGIQSLIETCIEFGASHEDIVTRLMQKFSLTRKSAEEYCGKFI